MNITELREKYGLSRKQLSILTEIPQRTIQSWEIGDRKPPEYIFHLIENTLKQNVVKLNDKPILIPSSEVLSDSRLNRILKKDYESLSVEDKAYINTAYIAQMKSEWLKKDRGGIYGYTQRTMAYNSSKMEGNRLTEEDTAELFETEFLPDGNYRRKDIEEMSGHFLMFNYMLSHINDPLSINQIKEFHKELESGVFEFRANGYIPGEFKKKYNTVSNITTSAPDKVVEDIINLFNWYKNNKVGLNNKDADPFYVLSYLHANYEKIHPFQDGNGRTGRCIVFKESILQNVFPIIIKDEDKAKYRKVLNAAQTKDDFKGLTDFFEKASMDFYPILQKYMYDHQIELEDEKDEEER